MNTEKIEKLKKSLSNTLLPADLKPKIEAEIKRLEDLDSKQPTKRVAKRTSKAKPSRTKTPKRTAMSLAKEIRKEGESWSDARARASKMMKEKSHTATKDVETELTKLAEGGYLTDPTFGTFQNQVFADGGGVGVETILFAVKKGEPDWNEVLITNNPAKIEDAKKWALANGFDRLRVSKIDMNEKPDFEKTFAKGGEIEFKHSNLRIVGTGMDSNGNKVVKISFPNQRLFSIQTNGNLPNTHKLLQKTNLKDAEFSFGEIQKMEDEILDYVEKYGSANQKKSLRIYGSYLDKDNFATGGNINEKTKKMRKQKLKKGDTVTIYGKRWFDRVNGNTYHTAEVEVNGTTLGKSSMTYGYDDQYLETGKEILLEHYDFPRGMTERSPMWQLRDNGVTLTKYVTDGLKRDLAKGGGVRKVGDREYPLGRNWTNDHRHINKSDDHEVKYTRKKRFATGGGVDGNEVIKLKVYANSGNIIREGDFLINYNDSTITFPSGKTFKVVEDREYTIKMQKTQIKANRGIKGLSDFLKEINTPNTPFSGMAMDLIDLGKDGKFELGGVMTTDLAGHTGGALGGDPTMLDGVSGTSYTGLVGETGAMSSGEMFMAGGTLPNGSSQAYMITESLGNPAQHYAKGGGVKMINGREYNYGRVWTKDHNEFDKGSDHEVEYRRKKSSFFANGGAMEKIKYDDVLEVLKEKLQDSIDELPSQYEYANDYKGEEVEKQSRDGFIAFTDGGYEVTWFEQMSMFSGSGYGLPTKPLDDEMERQIAYNYQLAKETFIENYPDIAEELGEDNIDYNSLYEAGYESEAEELSEMEMNYDGDDTIMCEIGAYYYDTENYRGIDEKHTIRLYGLVNLESPYHRRGNLDDSYDIDITFDSISELKEKVDAGLKDIIEWFDGKYYNDSNAEMKIRRMADGGAFAPNVSNGTEFMSGVYADGGFMDGVYADGGNIEKGSTITLKNDVYASYTNELIPKGTKLRLIATPPKVYGKNAYFVYAKTLNNKEEIRTDKLNFVEKIKELESSFADGGFMDGVYAKGGKVSPFKNIMETNTITEKEINLIKLRMNNDKVDEATQEVIDYIWENSPQLTPDQNKKGIDYLRNLWKSPTGKERTNNPFGYREQDALETFEYFELRGFYDAGNRYRKFYVPLYTCVGADSSFEYAFYNGQVNILG